MVAKSFSRKQIYMKKNCEKTFFVEIFLVAKSFPRKEVCFKNSFEKNVMVEYFLWLQNHFLEIRFDRKIFGNNSWSIISYGCKIISPKTGLQEKKFWETRFGRKFFMVQNHFLENRFARKILSQKFLVKNFLWFQNHFL